MEIEIIRRICLAKHLYELACGCLRSVNELYLFSGVNLLQDAVEAFLVAVADFVGASLDERTLFDKYFVLINEKISPKELPFKNKLLRLNKVRVASKHHGIQPDRNECQRLSLAVREFFEEVSTSILCTNFSTVSSIDLIRDGETKEILIDAKSALDKQNYAACAIGCRKAIYLEIEKDYDIPNFKEGYPINVLLSALCKAPFFAKEKKYIDEHVRKPTDYIVYDHSRLDQELLKYAIDNTAFWNLLRLTPAVYRTNDKNWVVENDFIKLDDENLIDTIEYIFNTTVDIVVAIHIKQESIKSSKYRRYYLELVQEGVPVYEKADTNSNIVCNTPKGLTSLLCDFCITGLQEEGPFWYVRNYEEASSFFGFIHNDFVKK